MKRLSNRTIFLLILMGVLVLGLGFFTVRYFLYAGEWVTFQGSPHVYSGSNLSSGKVTDRDGVLLLDSTDGRVYAEDPVIRAATMHLLGDRYGYISAPVLTEYADYLVGFNPVNGIFGQNQGANTAVLSISAQVQKVAYEALGNYHGTVGVYNYKTGEILCAVTSPSYDPDNMPDVEGDQTGAYDGVYLNRFFQTSTVPGSIFKIVTAAAALETLGDLSGRTFTCNGTLDIGGDTLVCNGTHGAQTLTQAFANSCNVAFGQLAMELGPDVLEAYAEKLGITESLTFDGLTTAAGSFDLTGAADFEVAWSGCGQYNDLINPCQYLTVLGVIANGGEAALPYIMDRVEGGLLNGYEHGKVTTGRVLDRSVTDTVAQMMRNNVVNVYGAWQFPDLEVCAKSGTAELSPGDTPNATFAGFIRDENYPLAFIVIIEHGGAGSAAAAPIAGQVLNACVSVLDAE